MASVVTCVSSGCPGWLLEERQQIGQPSLSSRSKLDFDQRLRIHPWPCHLRQSPRLFDNCTLTPGVIPKIQVDRMGGGLLAARPAARPSNGEGRPSLRPGAGTIVCSAKGEWMPPVCISGTPRNPNGTSGDPLAKPCVERMGHIDPRPGPGAGMGRVPWSAS
jgi:hypothetical protein